MAVTEYQYVKKYLADLKNSIPFPVYLIHGEEYLYKSTFKKLLGILLPDSGKSLNYEEIDGSEGNIYNLAETLNTYSFLSKRKVIAFTDAKIFYSKNDEEAILDKAKTAYDKSDLKKAAKLVASLIGVLGLTFDDLIDPNQVKRLKVKPEKQIDSTFFDDIVKYSKDNNLTVPAARDYAKLLQDTIEKGFPKGNILFITTDLVDKRKSLYKTIKEIGMIVDCSVPKGSRMADKKAQEAMMNEVMKLILGKSGKTLDPAAYRSIIEKTGFDLNTFASSLEKLINFAGSEARITVEHVASVLKRTREDPIYELTGAVSDRNTQKALFYLGSLLSAKIFPLQVLAAIINQIRKLIILKDFTESAYGKTWRKGLTFNQFKSNVMSSIVSYDKEISGAAESWETIFEKQEAKGKKKKKVKTDLLIAKNPNNPYPIFQSLLKAENFTKKELIEALSLLAQTDLRLKTTNLNSKIVLEEMLIAICQRG